MQSDSRLEWIADSVCQSLGVGQEAFHALLDDEEASSLLTSFLSGEGALSTDPPITTQLVELAFPAGTAR